MLKKVTIIILMILLSGLVFAENENDFLTIKTQIYEIGVYSPMDMTLNSEFKVYPESIKIREQNNISLVSGETIIYRMDFENKLDYSIIGRYELSLDLRDITQMKNLGIYVSEALNDIDCISKNGAILKYNNERIKIMKNEESFNLCSETKTMNYHLEKDKLILDVLLDSGINEKYFLIVTTPVFSVDSTLVFKETIKLKNNTDTEFFNLENFDNVKDFGPITTANTQNSEELKELNAFRNQEKYNRINPNFNSNPKTKEVLENQKQETRDTNKSTTQNLKDGAETLKSKATALVTMTPTKWGLLIFGVLAVIALLLFINSKKDRNLSNVK